MHSTCQGFKEYDMKPFVSKKFVLTEVLKMKIETCYAWPKCKILQQKKKGSILHAQNYMLKPKTPTSQIADKRNMHL